ncbi:MAG TPA: DUF4097 family beta strand repeat-containing protein [Opitutus sp.]|nr:DUF4097 family beta strand repeat-containing protein [Opitutus sp.]
MTSSRLFPSFLLAAALAVLLLAAARGEETSSIKFSDPSKPGTLKVTVSNGDIRIRGSDTPEILVRSEAQPQGAEQRKDGLRVLTSATSYSLTEKANVVSLTHGADSWPGSGGDFEIEVPRSTNVIVSNSLGGEIEISDVHGDLEVKSLNGEVQLNGVSSGVLVETMNGQIDVNVRALAESKPLSFTSMNGEVNLRLPVDTKASVRLRTHNGSILTDFDEQQLITKTISARSAARPPGSPETEELRTVVREGVRAGMEAAREATRAAMEAVREARREMGHDSEGESDEALSQIPVPPTPPLPPMTGGKIITGTLNGGGPEIRVSTMNGDVTLRKAQ